MRSAERTTDTTMGLLAIAGAAALWAIAATVARSLFDEGVDPVHLAASRSLITFAGLVLVPAARSALPRASLRRDGPLLIALGLSIALVNTTYYLAIERLHVAVALVLQYTAPAMVVTWTAIATRRRPPGPLVAAVASALAGVVLVSELPSGDLGKIDGVGMTMALLSAVLFASYTLLSQEARTRYGTLGAMLRAFALSTLLWVIVLSPAGAPRDLLVLDRLPSILFVGLGGTLSPFLLYVWGVGRVRAERASIAATLEPVIAGVIAWVWLGQSLSALQVAGGVLVIAAVTTVQATRREPVVAPEP